MGAFARRLLLSLFFCWSVVTITFFLIHLTPGDPVDLMVEATATPRDREALKKELGLDKPLLAQYEAFFGGALRGDLGKSFLTKKQVTSELTQALPSTITLAFTSVLFSILLGLPLGIAAAAKKGTPVHFFSAGLFDARSFYAQLHHCSPSYFILQSQTRSVARQRKWRFIVDHLAHGESRYQPRRCLGQHDPRKPS
jgi:ABC-type microcin C transport system permease subunit YejB